MVVARCRIIPDPRSASLDQQVDPLILLFYMNFRHVTVCYEPVLRYGLVSRRYRIHNVNRQLLYHTGVIVQSQCTVHDHCKVVLPLILGSCSRLPELLQ